MPPGGDAVFAVEDATGLVTADPRKFVARQIPLQDQLLSNGTGLAFCPNAPSFWQSSRPTFITPGPARVIRASRLMAERPGRGSPGFPSDPSTGNALQAAGSIAISRRGGWRTGGDHLVWLPTGDGPTYYSHDGGKSWKPSAGFPTKNGYWIFALKQRSLAADPFTPDKFYLVGSWAGGFYVSTDGGKSWQQQEEAGLSSFNHHSQLAVNRAVKNDLWFCDGWEGQASTASGTAPMEANRSRNSAASNMPSRSAWVQHRVRRRTRLTLFISTAKWPRPPTGESSVRLTPARPGSAFRFTPPGLFDQPTCMAASWDHFAEVIVGFGGNSFVVGTDDASHVAR